MLFLNGRQWANRLFLLSFFGEINSCFIEGRFSIEEVSGVVPCFGGVIGNSLNGNGRFFFYSDGMEAWL